ncbi:MAG: hypothetical protein RR383_08400, partial [Muribaculaceae bacterium]
CGVTYYATAKNVEDVPLHTHPKLKTQSEARTSKTFSLHPRPRKYLCYLWEKLFHPTQAKIL